MSDSVGISRPTPCVAVEIMPPTVKQSSNALAGSEYPISQSQCSSSLESSPGGTVARALRVPSALAGFEAQVEPVARRVEEPVVDEVPIRRHEPRPRVRQPEDAHGGPLGPRVKYIPQNRGLFSGV